LFFLLSRAPATVRLKPGISVEVPVIPVLIQKQY